MLRVGIIAEGTSDFLVLERIMRSLHAEIDFIRIHPDQSFPHFGQGWRGVKAWCEEHGPRLEVLMTGIPSRPIHLLVIHSDCSMADKLGVEHPCPPASATAEALAEAVVDSWLRRTPKPDFVVIATPSMSSDAWVAATFDPPHPNLTGIECDKAVENEFVRRRILKRRDGQVKKPARVYGEIAERMSQSLDLVFAHCTRAMSFKVEFEVATSRVFPQNDG